MTSVPAKSVVIFAPYAAWSPHFETDLELAERYLADGWRVTLLRCLGSLATCEPNGEHEPRVCEGCVSRFDAGLRWLGPARVTVADFLSLTPDQARHVEQLRNADYASFEDVHRVYIDDADIGWGALSSLVTRVREQYPDLRALRSMLGDHIAAAATSYYSIKNQLERLRPDRFVVFNGRFGVPRAALRAAQSVGVSIEVHERGGALGRFSVTRDAHVLEIETRRNMISDAWSGAPLSDDEKRRVGAKWFTDRRANKIQNWWSFTASQTKGLVPAAARSEKLKVAVFNSSDDEMFVVEEWRNPHYADQSDGLYRLFSDLSPHPNIQLFVREHPNLAGVRNSQTRMLDYLAARFPNVEVIRASSPVSTYALLDSVDAVVTYGSTVGIEAVFSGIPSILMGHAYHADMPSLVKPASHTELIALLDECARDRAALARIRPNPDDALRYGFFYETFGEPYRYVRVNGVFDVEMVRGQEHTVIRPDRLLQGALRVESYWKRIRNMSSDIRDVIATRGRR